MEQLSQKTPITVQCASCRGAIVLTCTGLAGVASYPIYNQFDCPHCRKQNSARTPGHIVSVEPA